MPLRMGEGERQGVTGGEGVETTGLKTLRGARLDRYIDHLEVQTGLKANRGMIARRAIDLFLETHAPTERKSEATRS